MFDGFWSGLHDGQVNQRTTTIEIVNSRWKYADDHLAGIIYNSTEVKDSHIVADQGFHNSTAFPKLGFRYNNERNASHGRTDGDTPTVINATKSEVELPKPTKSKSRKRCKFSFFFTHTFYLSCLVLCTFYMFLKYDMFPLIFSLLNVIVIKF